MIRGWTTRTTGLAALLILVLVAVGWFTYVRDPPRHQVGQLSCRSGTFAMTAADFSGVPRWDSPEEALGYTLDLEGTAPRDGWELHMTREIARWERHDEGHLVGLVQLPREGTGWGYAGADVCEETRMTLTNR